MNVDKQEFLKIIEENNARLRHLCKVYAADSSDEEDLYQEIVLQIWRSLPQFKGDAKLSTWVYRIALNVSISFVREKKTRQKYHRAYQKENEIKSEVEAKTIDKNKMKMKQLYDAISQLNASEKAIITMYLEDFTYAEMAKVTNITKNYVGVKLNRIKQKLTQIINKNDEI